MTSEEMGVELRVHIIRKYSTQAEAARHWGVSTAFVSAVVNGNKSPTKAMLDDAGFECIRPAVVYRKKRPGASQPKPEGEAK